MSRRGRLKFLFLLLDFNYSISKQEEKKLCMYNVGTTLFQRQKTVSERKGTYWFVVICTYLCEKAKTKHCIIVSNNGDYNTLSTSDSIRQKHNIYKPYEYQNANTQHTFISI